MAADVNRRYIVIDDDGYVYPFESGQALLNWLEPSMVDEATAVFDDQGEILAIQGGGGNDYLLVPLGKNDSARAMAAIRAHFRTRKKDDSTALMKSILESLESAVD